MKKNIEEIIKEYENNINNARKYNSYINEVREYNGYIFKEIKDSEKFKNESRWLKELMNLNYCTPKIIGTYNQKIIMEKIKGNAIKDIDISIEKWQLYNRFYAFRIYSKMLTRTINRDSEFEEYLKNILILKNDRVTEWIKKYNLEYKI